MALTFYFWLLWFARTKFAGLHFDHILVPELASDYNVAPSDLAAPHHRSSFQKIAYSHPASFDAKDVVVQATFDEEHPLKLAKCGAFLSSRFQRQFEADLEYYSVVARSAHQHPQYTCLCIFRVVCMYVCACMHADQQSFGLYHTAPIHAFGDGWAVLGEISKWVPVSTDRIRDISVEDGSFDFVLGLCVDLI